MKILEKILGWLLGVMVIAIAVLVLLQVFCRSFLNVSLSWTMELATFCFGWVVFLGAALGFKDKIHFSMDFTLTKLSPRLKKVLAIINNLLITGFTGIMVKYGFDVVMMAQYQSSPAMAISMAFFYATIPVSGIIMLIYTWVPEPKEEEKDAIIIE